MHMPLLKRFPDNGTTETQLQKLCSQYEIPLVGIFNKDEIKTPAYGNYIVNLNGSSHWVALIHSPQGTFWFDSYGFSAPQEINDMFPVYNYTRTDIQDPESSSCGYYVIAFLKFMRHPSKAKYETFIDMFTDDTFKNEQILSKLLTKFPKSYVENDT